MPLTLASWGDWQSEKFCGYSLIMIAELDNDDLTQGSCLDFCQQTDQTLGPLYADQDPSFCCDFEIRYTGDRKCLVWQTDFLRETDPEIFEDDIFYSFVFNHKEYEDKPEEKEEIEASEEKFEEEEQFEWEKFLKIGTTVISYPLIGDIFLTIRWFTFSLSFYLKNHIWYADTTAV